MSGLLKRGDNPAEISTPWTDLAQRQLNAEDAAEERQKASMREELKKARERKNKLLAEPDKIDSMVAGNVSDIYPLTAKPKLGGLASKVAGVDDSLKGHPLQGATSRIKESFAAALQDERYTGVDEHQLLSAVKKSVLQETDEKGVSLLERAHEYKFKKDHGLFNFFNRDDKDTVALPGYEEYKKKNEKPYDTSLTEAVAINTGMTLVGALLTGGASVPAQLAGRLAVAAAVAYPEFKLFDTGANLVASKRKAGEEGTLSDLGLEMAGGMLGMVGGKALIKGGLNVTLSKAVAAGKISQSARDILSVTGLATDAIKTYNAGVAEKSANELLSKRVHDATRSMMDGVAKESRLSKLSQEVEMTPRVGGPKLDEFAGYQRPPVLTNEMAVEATVPAGKRSGVKYWESLQDGRFKPTPLFDTQKLVDAGIAKDTIEYVNSNPMTLFNYIKSPEAVDAVFKEISQGSSAQEAIIRNFNREAAIEGLQKVKTIDDLATAASQTEKVIAEAEARISRDSIYGFGKESKVSSTSYKKSLNIPKVELGNPVAPPVEVAEGIGVKSQLGKAGSDAGFGKDVVAPVVEVGGTAVKTPEGVGVVSSLGKKGTEAGFGKDVVAPKIEVGNPVEVTVDETIESALANTNGGLGEFLEVINKETGFGKSVTAPKIELGNPGKSFDLLGKNIANKVMSVSMLTAGSIGLASFLSPEDAEASGIGAAGKLVSEAVGKTFFEGVEGNVKAVAERIKQLHDLHLITEPVQPGQVKLPEFMQRQLKTSPDVGFGLQAESAVIGKRKSVVDSLAGFLSPDAFSRVYGTTTNSISVQMASMQNAIVNNTDTALAVSKNILSTVPGIEAKHSKEIADFMKPVQQRFDDITIPMKATEYEINKIESKIRQWTEAVKGNPAEEEVILETIKAEQARVAELKKVYAEYEGGYASAHAELREAQKELAYKYPSSRISLAAEDSLDFKKYPFLKDVPFSYEEKAAVALFKEFHGSYKQRSIGAGLEVLEGDYVRHSRDLTKINSEWEKKTAELGMSADSKKIALTDYFRRTKYSEQFVPDISRNVFEYVPDAERRINVATFWKKGKADGWDAFSKNDAVKSNKVWSDFFDRLKTAYNPEENTFTNRMANRYASLEVLRLLTALPSAPFKHFFKNEGTWATLGFTNSMKHIPDAITVSIRNGVNSSMEMLGKKGTLQKGEMDDFVRSVMNQRRMSNPLADLERPEALVTKYDEWVDKLNNVGGIGIRAVEAFDRTHTIQAAFEMSLKKGMTAEQSMYSIYDTILKNNFLGGGLNPDWMKNPKIRAIALFQNTPFKILERRVVNGLKFGDDVKTAWGVIKNQNLETTLKELTDLRTFVHGAQNEFKKNLIYDALTSSKDVFGHSVSGQFMKEWIIAGSIVAAGDKFLDMDFSAHSFHLPFIKSDKQGQMVAMTSPIVDATWKTLHPKEDEKEFFVSRFLGQWLNTTGGAQPLVLHKFRRITKDDIPEIYRDSMFKYLFAVPSAGMGH